MCLIIAMPAHGFYCCVDGCKVNVRDHVMFFRCPKDSARCQQWKQILGFVGDHKYAKLTPEEACRRIKICSAHFDGQSYTSSGKRLLNTAVPSKLLSKLDDYKQEDESVDKEFVETTAMMTSDEEVHALPLKSDATSQIGFQEYMEVTDKSCQTGLHLSETTLQETLTFLDKHYPKEAAMLIKKQLLLLNKVPERASMKPSTSREKIIPEIIKCRTCLQPVESTSINITEKCISEKTIKDILLLFIPDMVTSPAGDFICCKCAKRIRNFTNFIKKCLTVEKLLVEETLKTQWAGENNSVPTSDEDNVDSGPTSSVQNGVEPIKIQPIPISYLLAPTTKNPEDDLESVIPVNYLLAPTTNTDEGLESAINPIGLNTNDFPHIKKLVVNRNPSIQTDVQEVYRRPRKKVKQRSNEETRICYTCRDVFACNDWTMIECPKCAGSDKEMEIDLSDVTSNNIDNTDRMEVKVEKHVVKLGNDVAKTRDVFKSLRGMFRDTILSVKQTPDQIDKFLVEISNSAMNIVDYRPRNSAGKKRLLLLGNSLTQCSECKDLMKNPKALKDHFQKAHTIQELVSEEEEDPECRKTFECPFCDTKTTTELSLVDHLTQNHSIESPFKCERCGKGFKKRDVYLEHSEKFANSPNCSRLSKSTYKRQLNSHGRVVCDQCGKTFSNPHYFKVHYATHIKGKDQTDEGKPESFLCPYCGKLLSNQQGWRLHVQIHGHRARNYICHMCPKTFLTMHYLNKHIANSHGEKSISCPICGIKVRTKSALVSHHKLKHSNDYMHFCKSCNQGFNRTDYYKRHIATHSTSREGRKKKYNYSVKLESKLVKCKYCLKLFKNVYLLRTHLLSHVKIMRYKCKFCDMTFANTGTRFRHQKRHTDPNFELSCTVCWKRMDSKEKLEAHLAKHDDSKRYECTTCGELFCSKYLLRHHLSEQHIGEEDVQKEKETVLADALEEFLL